MGIVLCDVHNCTRENEHGVDVPGVEVVCRRCGQTSFSFGEGEPSVLRSCAILSEQCSRGRHFHKIAAPGDADWTKVQEYWEDMRNRMRIEWRNK